jgi:hypothetical protein
MDVQTASLALQERLSNARDEIDELKEERRSLSERISGLEAKKQERERYTLAELESGYYAYRYSLGDGDLTPQHYICQQCMDISANRVVLQETALWGVVSLRCPNCKHEVLTGERRAIT